MKKGQSLFEIVIAISLIALVATTIVSLTTITLKNNIHSRNKSFAQQKTQEAYEWLRSEKNASWSTFYGYASLTPGTTYCLEETMIFNTGSCNVSEVLISNGVAFTRETILIKENTNSVNIVITVEWDESGKTYNTSIESYLNNY